jgi:hypothetical protein
VLSAFPSRIPQRRAKLIGILPDPQRRVPRSTNAAALALLAAIFVMGLAIAPRAAAYVYWTTPFNCGCNNANPFTGNIGRANLDGTGVNQSFITGLFHPGRVAVDARHIYWTDASTDRIGRANLDGSGVDPNFIRPVGFASGLAVDADHIYWGNDLADAIGRANLDGTGVNPSFISGLIGFPFGLAVDAGHLYWASGGSGWISRANLDGTGVIQNFIVIGEAVSGVAVDASHIYWATVDGDPTILNDIGRANLDGSGAIGRLGFLTGFDPREVAVDANHLYWTDTDPYFFPAGGLIGQANLDGTMLNRRFVSAIPSDPAGPVGVAVDALGPPPLPSITTTSPSDGVSGTSRTAPITVLFDQPMDKPSAEAAFSLKRSSNGDPVGGSFSWSKLADMLKFSPSSPLAAARVYTATVGPGARNLAGKNLADPYVWQFTTTPQPLIAFVYPVDGATGIPRNAPIVVGFDTAMDKPSAQAAFSLKLKKTGAPVSGAFGWYGNALIFKPSGDLAGNTYYEARQRNTAKNLDGRPLDSGRTWGFTTAP